MNNNKIPLDVNVYLNQEILTQIQLNKSDKKINLNLEKKLKKGVNEIMFEILNPITPVSKLESVEWEIFRF